MAGRGRGWRAGSTAWCGSRARWPTRVTRCSSPRRARASTCSPTTRSAEIASPRWRGGRRERLLPRVEAWEARALVVLTLAAFSFGLIQMYGASAYLARTQGLPGHFFAAKQLSAAAVGVVVAAVLSRVDYRRFRRWAWPMLVVFFLMLIVVTPRGTEPIAPRVNGARRWL